jgi:hypothetical protein
MPGRTCWIVSISYRFLKPSSVLMVPNSGMLGGPLGENSSRSVLAPRTRSMTPANSSGLWPLGKRDHASSTPRRHR